MRLHSIKKFYFFFLCAHVFISREWRHSGKRKELGFFVGGFKDFLKAAQAFKNIVTTGIFSH
jgi:hypothetical protein